MGRVAANRQQCLRQPVNQAQGQQPPQPVRLPVAKTVQQQAPDQLPPHQHPQVTAAAAAVRVVGQKQQVARCQLSRVPSWKT